MKKRIAVSALLVLIITVCSQGPAPGMPSDPVTGVIMVLMGKFAPGQISMNEMTDELRAILESMHSHQVFSFTVKGDSSTVTLNGASTQGQSYTLTDQEYAKRLLRTLGKLNGALPETKHKSKDEISSAEFTADCSQAYATKTFTINYNVTWKDGEQASINRSVSLDEMKPDSINKNADGQMLPPDPISIVIIELLDHFAPGMIKEEDVTQELKTVLEGMIESKKFSFKVDLEAESVVLKHDSNQYTENNSRYAFRLARALSGLNTCLNEFEGIAQNPVKSAEFSADCSEAEQTKTFTVNYTAELVNGETVTVNRNISADEMKP